MLIKNDIQNKHFFFLILKITQGDKENRKKPSNYVFGDSKLEGLTTCAEGEGVNEEERGVRASTARRLRKPIKFPFQRCRAHSETQDQSLYLKRSEWSALARVKTFPEYNFLHTESGDK